MLGREHLDEELAGLRLRISYDAFFQTNTEMAERLYAIVGEFAELSGRERVYDLYCGIGTIGLALAGAAGDVWGLESVPSAVADAEENARRNDISNASFVCADARLGIRPLIERAGTPDVVIVDPPRAGLSKKIVRRVIECDARGGSFTCRATRRHWRRTPPSSRRPAIGCAACEPWTCSPRRLTSSAWRCWRNDEPRFRSNGGTRPGCR